ncbi:MAG: hypothetical protein R3315_00610 [Woeseiaceae bacterium]|nr:hypothetical protein [Woeseiaceae bacterium]
MEGIERAGFEAWYEAVGQAGLPDFDWSLVRVGDALCSVCPSEPSILVNRVFGPGPGSSPTLDDLVEIREIYLEAGITRFFLHVLPDNDDPGLEDRLMEAGFRRYRGWMKFARGPGPVPDAQTDLTVRRIFGANADAFAAIVTGAFDLRPSTRPAVAALAGAEGWWLYMAFDGDTPAGTGALFMRDGMGSLDWGATAPRFRRRGSQSAILRMRLKDAFGAGCEQVVTMTGEAVPGEEQVSYANILKAGFDERYLRENWVPAGAGV